VTRLEACLIDAYGTILTCDYAAHARELPVLAGIPADEMYAEFARHAPDLTVGRLTMTELYERILRACGTPRAGLAGQMADRGRELFLATARLYDDVLPFLRVLRSAGIRSAIVSNCDEYMRDLLDAAGVTALTDALVLSCEVGVAKPAAQIYRHALDRLGVAAQAALFVDDNPASCAGAAALGLPVAQMDRGRVDDFLAGATVVSSLPEVEEMLREPGRR
jgi:putative hydrolase of the HAD superfamily